MFWGNGYSRRFLLQEDGFGITVCNTLGFADSDSPLNYTQHLEACYYIQGTGEYAWEKDTQRHPILAEGESGTVFIMDQHDSHNMRIKE